MTDKNKIPSSNDAVEIHYIVEELVETAGAGPMWDEISAIRFGKYLEAVKMKNELELSNPGDKYRIVSVKTSRKTIYPVEADTELGTIMAAKTQLIFVEAQLLARNHPASKPIHAAFRELRKAEGAL